MRSSTPLAASEDDADQAGGAGREGQAAGAGRKGRAAGVAREDQGAGAAKANGTVGCGPERRQTPERREAPASTSTSMSTVRAAQILAGTGGGPATAPEPRGHRERAGGPALLRLLGALAHAEEPLSISELAERIGVDQPRASRLVQQAVELGHAVREADPGDARRTRVRLTDTGEHLVHGVRDRQRHDATSALAALAPDERTELLRLMAKLAQAWPHE